jgi:hypothetical protein
MSHYVGLSEFISGEYFCFRMLNQIVIISTAALLLIMLLHRVAIPTINVPVRGRNVRIRKKLSWYI